MMRSGTTLLQRLLAADPRFHCAYGWEVVEVAPKLDYDVRRRDDPRIADQREARGDVARAGPRTVRDPPDVRPRARRGDRLPVRRVPVARARSRVRTCPTTGPGSTHRTSRPHTPTCTGCCSSCSGRSGSADSTAQRWVLKSPAHLGYLDALRAQFPDLHVVHMHRDPREHHPVGRQPQRHPARDARRRRRPPPGRRASGCERMGWTNDRAMATRDGWADDAAAVSPTSSSTTRSPIRSGRWPACTTRSGCR